MRLVYQADYIGYGRKYKLLCDNSFKNTPIKPPKMVKHKYFSINTRGTIIAKKGYVWDGASGGIDTTDFMRGSLFHDVATQAIQEGLLDPKYRKAADELLWQALKEDGMAQVRIWWVYNAIRFYVRFIK